MIKRSLAILPYTWANRPASGTYNGRQINITDVGMNGSIWWWNSSKWVPEGSGAIALNQSALPMVLQSSGTINNTTGGFTLSTALPQVLSGGCYMYFPTGALYTSSPFGLYYCVMSSTTVGVVYANTYNGGLPVIPASPTALTTVAGAYTQTTGNVTLCNTTMPANIMGPNGKVKFDPLNWAFPANTNSKSIGIYVGSYAVWNRARNSASIAQECIPMSFENKGVTNRNLVKETNASGYGTAISAYSLVDSTVDTTTSLVISSQAQLAVATDYVIFNGLDCYLLPS